MEKKVKTPSMKEIMTLISRHLCITRMPSRPMRESRAWKITRLFPRSRRHCLPPLPRLQPQERVHRRPQTSLPLTQGHPSMRPALLPRLHPQERTRCRRMLTRTMILLTIMGLKALRLLNLLAYRCLENLSWLQRPLRLLINHRRHPVDRLEHPLGHHGPPQRSLWTCKGQLQGGDRQTHLGHLCLWKPGSWLMRLTWPRIRTGGLRQTVFLQSSKVERTSISNRRTPRHKGLMAGLW